MVNSLKIHGATAANTIHLGKECSIWNNKRFSSPYFFRSNFVTNRGNARLVALGDISQQVSWVLAYFSHCYYRHYIYCILNSVANSIKSIAFGENCNFWEFLDFQGLHVWYYFYKSWQHWILLYSSVMANMYFRFVFRSRKAL